jgi:hypothetical protein
MPAQLFGLWPTRAANLDCRAAIIRGGTRMLARHQRQAKHLGAVSFDAVKMLLLARLENRPARLDLTF